MKDLCAAAYSDGTLPVASDPKQKECTPGRHQLHYDEKSSAKSTLFDKQSKSWADVAGLEVDTASNTHTESNSARQHPRDVQFRSKVTFHEVETKLSANNGLTVLTRDNLTSMKDEICAQFKDELSSAISEMSINSDYKTANKAFRLDMNKQIQAHNQEMKDTMHAMKTMMVSIQQFVEASMPKQ
jgi:hypothetical protein